MFNNKHITKILASALYFAALALPFIMVTDVVKGLANQKVEKKDVEPRAWPTPPYDGSNI